MVSRAQGGSDYTTESHTALPDLARGKRARAPHAEAALWRRETVFPSRCASAGLLGDGLGTRPGRFTSKYEAGENRSRAGSGRLLHECL